MDLPGFAADLSHESELLFYSSCLFFFHFHLFSLILLTYFTPVSQNSLDTLNKGILFFDFLKVLISYFLFLSD